MGIPYVIEMIVEFNFGGIGLNKKSHLTDLSFSTVYS